MKEVVALVKKYIDEFSIGYFGNMQPLLDIMKHHQSAHWHLKNSKAIKELLEAFYKISELQSKEPENAIAKINLALFFQEGILVEKNHIQAITLYKESFKLGNSHAANNLGCMYRTHDYLTAIKYFKESAKLGNSYALGNLAEMYRLGLGGDRDYQQSIKLYRQAVELGNSYAMVGLAFMYELGLGVEKDDQQAIDLLKVASGLGNSEASIRLAEKYQYGLGIEQDYYQAIKKAIDLGNNSISLRISLNEMHKKAWGTEQDVRDLARLYRLAKTILVSSKLSIYQQYHNALSHKQDIDLVLSLMVEHPELLSELVCFEYFYDPKCFATIATRICGDSKLWRILDQSAEYFRISRENLAKSLESQQKEQSLTLPMLELEEDMHSQSLSMVEIKLRLLTHISYDKLSPDELINVINFMSYTLFDLYLEEIENYTPALTTLSQNVGAAIKALEQQPEEVKNSCSLSYGRMASILIKYKSCFTYEAFKDKRISFQELCSLSEICLNPDITSNEDNFDLIINHKLPEVSLPKINKEISLNDRNRLFYIQSTKQRSEENTTYDTWLETGEESTSDDNLLETDGTRQSI